MTIYVGNLPLSVSEYRLAELFLPYGRIEFVRVVTDRVTGLSRGFAFVDMEDEHEACAAISALSGLPLEGRTLRVNDATLGGRLKQREHSTV